MLNHLSKRKIIYKRFIRGTYYVKRKSTTTKGSYNGISSLTKTPRAKDGESFSKELLDNLFTLLWLNSLSFNYIYICGGEIYSLLRCSLIRFTVIKLLISPFITSSGVDSESVSFYFDPTWSLAEIIYWLSKFVAKTFSFLN